MADDLKRELDKIAQATRELEKVSNAFKNLAQKMPQMGEIQEYAGLEFEDAIEDLSKVDPSLWS